MIIRCATLAHVLLQHLRGDLVSQLIQVHSTVCLELILVVLILASALLYVELRQHLLRFLDGVCERLFLCPL